MDEAVFDDVDAGRGTEFGTKVHDFAEAYALGEEVEPDGDDEENVAQFIDSFAGERLVEEDAYLPLTVDGDPVTISDVNDRLHATPDRVEIVDSKTDRGHHAETEYRKQLSIYDHVAIAVYPNRDSTASTLHTHTDDQQ